MVQRREVVKGMIEVTCSLDGKKFSFKAGQHIRITLNSLLHNDPKGKTRTFNILSSPNNIDYLSFTFRGSDSGFKQTMLKMPINEVIEIKGPFGIFTLPENSNHRIVLIAEDVGISPCISMILYATEEKFSNKINLLYSHTGATMAYGEDLKTIEKENLNFMMKTKLGQIDADFIKKSVERTDDIQWYIAGTSEMINRVRNSLVKMNVNLQNIHIEEFSGY